MEDSRVIRELAAPNIHMYKGMLECRYPNVLAVYIVCP